MKKALTTVFISLILFSLIGCTHVPTKEEFAAFYIQKAEQIMLEQELSYTNIKMDYTKDFNYNDKTWHQYNLTVCLDLQNLDYPIIANLLSMLDEIYNPDSRNNLLVTRLVELKTQLYKLQDYSLCEYPKGAEVYNIISVKNGENLTRDEKEYICKEIERLYDYYDEKEGHPTGDKYSTVIFEEVSKKYNILNEPLMKIWRERYI